MSLFKNLFKKEEQQSTEKSVKLVAALTGTIKPITECPDPVFSQKIMGDGYLIEPTNGTVVSPVDGEIQTVFPTKHAIGILSTNGDEIIVHVGLDTVTLNGEGFTTHVKAGDKVKAGQTILEVDFDLIKDKVPSIATPVVISNIGDRTVILEDLTEVTAGDVVAIIK